MDHQKNLVRFAHNWNDAILEYWVYTTEAVQHWARDVKEMQMGILFVIQTFGADMKWHPHFHFIIIPTFHHSMNIAYISSR